MNTQDRTSGSVPLPLTASPDGNGGYYIDDATEAQIADVRKSIRGAEVVTDFILRACNTHDALLAACNAMLNPMTAELDPEAFEFPNQNPVDVARNMARHAIAAAEGERAATG